MITIDDADTRAVLRAAADYIAEHGWIQHGYYADPFGEPVDRHQYAADGCAACAMGAIRISTGRHIDAALENWKAYALVETELSKRGADGHSVEVIHCWNDAPGRTADEVIEVLRAAGAEQ